MKILHVINTLKTGGAENIVTQLAPRLKAYGLDVEVAVFVGTETPFLKQLRSQGIKIHVFSVSGSVYNPKHILKLRRLIKHFDTIHTHNTSPQLFAVFANFGMGKHLVTTEHGGSNRRRAWKWYAVIDRWMYNNYSKIICISDKAEENLRNFIRSDSNRIVTIYNGIDIEKYSHAKAADIKNLGIPQGSKVLTMVAGFRWEKDQDTLICAMQYLPDRFHLCLVGNGVRIEECKELAKAKKVDHRVHFIGLRTDVPEILKASDYIAMSSHFEGLSLSSLEGMVVGKPFLASDVDGLREIVKDAGVLFEHRNPEEFASSVLKIELDNNLYHTIAERCFERASKYDISKMVNEYARIYTELKNERIQ